MAGTTARQQLAAALQPLLPTRWKFYDYDADLGDPAVVSVTMHGTRIEKPAEAPLSKHAMTFTVVVVEPSQDESKAPGLLDDEVDALLHALDRIDFINWTAADYVATPSARWGWQVTLTVITQKD